MKAAREYYLEVADVIGRQLCRDAIWDGDRCSWLGWVYQAPKSHVFRSLSSDLYGGTAGIALLLLELYRFTEDRQQLRCIDGALNQALSLLDKAKTNMSASFFEGKTGLAFVLAKAAQITGRHVLFEKSHDILRGLASEKLDPIAIDVVTGSAGAIPALICLASVLQCDELLEIADLHGQHLLRKAVTCDDQSSWQTTPGQSDAHLNGFSHGASGMATALLELYQVSQNQDYLQVALRALNFERRQLNRECGNWPDNRMASSNPVKAQASYSLAWCHGAPGIGLARLRQSQILPSNSAIADDLEIAISTTAEALSLASVLATENFSLCHGLAGNADLLIQAGQSLNRPNLSKLAEQVGQYGIEQILRQGRPWPCGNNGAGESPSLMLGTAGIAHFYLRLYDPTEVSSILITIPDHARRT